MAQCHFRDVAIVGSPAWVNSCFSGGRKRLNGVAGDALLCASYVGLIAMWSFFIPFNGAPDEQAHFFLLEYIYGFAALPAIGVDPVKPFVGPLTGAIYQNSQIWYHGLPFLHVLGGWIYAEGASWAFSFGEKFMAARAFNWTLGGVFLFSLLRCLRSIELPTTAGRGIAVFVAAIPQVTFVFAYFN